MERKNIVYAAGVDVGSTQTKACILDEKKDIVALALGPTGAYIERAAEQAFNLALEKAKLKKEQISYIIGTGYGRFKVKFGDDQITEISCHARGAHLLFPATRTVVDMGGQDTKAIKINENGEVVDFAMNDKCAAGTGRFLSQAAEVLKIPLDDIGRISLESKRPIKMTSVCTVFVESDIISYLAQGCRIDDILSGVHRSIAARTCALLRRTGLEQEITFTGGVSRNIGMVKALEDTLASKLNVSEQSHYIGAIGAAIFALERAVKNKVHGQEVELKEWINPEDSE
ncbi:MAG: 2-hydroxyglutaryl-CoA dehydratase [Planctomycetes bacterium]|nr:2-hydroxyglutaryl-CoA dehydratase [Planctomycetota bacterium]